MNYFLEPYSRSKNKIKVELDLSNYATKSDLKNTAGVGTLLFAKKTDLASLKANVDDSDKLKTVPVDLGKLNNAVTNEVVKKDVYDELVKNDTLVI